MWTERHDVQRRAAPLDAAEEHKRPERVAGVRRLRAKETITVCVLLSGRTLRTAGRARASAKCVCESVHGERPTYVPSVPLPPQMAIGVYCVGASVRARTHTLLPGWIGVWRTCVKCDLIFCTKHSINLLPRPCGNSVCVCA